MNLNTEQRELKLVFRALGDPTRREILQLLSQKQRSIGEVCEQFDVTRAAIKKHLNILEEGSLITVKTVGRERINRLKPKGLEMASKWMQTFDQFWDQRLNRLEKAIRKENSTMEDN